MADKTDSNKKPQQAPAARQNTQEQINGPEGRLREGVGGLSSSMDAPDPQSQAGRLADPRFDIVQRQALAGRIGRRQGNRHLSRILEASRSPAPAGLVQRQVLPGVVGQALATISLTTENRTRTEGQVTAEDELVPEGEQPGRFQGYGRRIQAQSRAAAEPNLCAVVEDRQGKFHALRTGWPGRSQDVQAEITPLENDFRHIWWVNQPGRRGALPETGSLSWRERVDRARDWWGLMRRRQMPEDFATFCRHSPSHAGSGANVDDLRRCLEIEFVDLLAVALDIDQNQIHTIPQGDRANPNALINFNIHMSDQGRGGIGRLPEDRESAAPRPTITVGPSAFDEESMLSAISTAIHESEHIRQANEATELLERWRRSRSRLSFPRWLREQLDRRRITQEQFDLANEQTGGGHAAGELMSYTEGFIRTYRHREIATTEYRFDALKNLVSHWGDTHSQAVKDEVYGRLNRFYRSLDPTHQNDLANFLRRYANDATNTLRETWQAMADRIL